MRIKKWFRSLYVNLKLDIIRVMREERREMSAQEKISAFQQVVAQVSVNLSGDLGNQLHVLGNAMLEWNTATEDEKREQAREAYTTAQQAILNSRRHGDDTPAQAIRELRNAEAEFLIS